MIAPINNTKTLKILLLALSGVIVLTFGGFEIFTFLLLEPDRIGFYLDRKQLDRALEVVEASKFDGDWIFPEHLKKYNEIQKKLKNASIREKSDLLAQRGVLRIDSSSSHSLHKALMDLNMALTLAPDNPRAHSAKAYYYRNNQLGVGGQPGGIEFAQTTRELSKAIDCADSNLCDLLILRAINYLWQVDEWPLSDSQKKLPSIRTSLFKTLAENDLRRALLEAEEKPDGLRNVYKAEIYFLLAEDREGVKQQKLAKAKGFYAQELIDEIEKNTFYIRFTPFNCALRLDLLLNSK